MTIAKTKSRRDGKQFLQEAFALEQKHLEVALQFSRASVTHPGILGNVNESHFLNVLRKYLPKRYAVDTGIVIDHTGSTSDQIDVIIYDHQYTPTLLDQENHKYITAEAVYGVLEVKPTVNREYIEYAGNKAESVRILKRTSIPIPHAGGEFSPKRLFPILAGIVAHDIQWSQGFASPAFRKALKSLNSNQRLECGLTVSGSCFDLFNQKETLSVGPSEQALVYFLFRLLQKLQSLGTVPAIDWNAYASAMGKLKD